MEKQPEDRSVSQNDIVTQGGDVAGGNIDKSRHMYFTNQVGSSSYLSRLYERLSSEIREDRRIQDTTEILDDFVATDEDEVVGLETKLTLGEMLPQLEYAKGCKERYAKNLVRFSMYESAQVIHAYFLGKVESGFVSDVLPVLANTPSEEKFRLMRRAVLDPIETMLGENPLQIHSKEIDGMAFFLTGKCKLKWG